jgi:hypothetical protein
MRREKLGHIFMFHSRLIPAIPKLKWAKAQ